MAILIHHLIWPYNSHGPARDLKTILMFLFQKYRLYLSEQKLTKRRVKTSENSLEHFVSGA